MAEHDRVYVNGELKQNRRKKFKCPPEIDWEKEVHRVNQENDAKMEASLTEDQRKKLKPKHRRGL